MIDTHIYLYTLKTSACCQSNVSSRERKACLDYQLWAIHTCQQRSALFVEVRTNSEADVVCHCSSSIVPWFNGIVAQTASQTCAPVYCSKNYCSTLMQKQQCVQLPLSSPPGAFRIKCFSCGECRLYCYAMLLRQFVWPRACKWYRDVQVSELWLQRVQRLRTHADLC